MLRIERNYRGIARAMGQRTDQRAGRQRSGWLTGAIAALALACASDAPPADPGTLAAPPTATADDLMVVDCLLPGQVRKLGSRFTYLTPRRPLKTSAIECEIRGGEYVSFDRANYATALAVWLPAAEAGEAEAQNYVGEIHERGLGRAPDYAAAAGWYRRAAEQGHAAAQINLGQMYEAGLGVEADVAEALSWYERAAGLEGGSWELVAAPELASLRDQLELRTAEAEHLRDELAGARSEIARVRQQRAEREVAASRALESLASQRAALGEERRRLEAEQARIAGAAKALERRRSEADSEAADRAASLSRAAELDAREAELDTEFDGLAAAALELARRSRELERERQRLQSPPALDPSPRNEERMVELARRERLLASRQAEIDAQAAWLAKQERRLARARGELEAIQLAQSSLEDYAVELGARESALHERSQRFAERARQLAAAEADAERKRQEVAELSTEIARLRSEAEAQRQKLAALADAGDAAAAGPSVVIAGPSIQMIDPLLVATRDAPGRPGLREVPTAPGVNERLIVGRVTAPAGLLSLTINDLATTAADNGLFQGQVSIAPDGTEVEIVAVDRQGERSVLDFVLFNEEATRGAETPAVSARGPAVPPDIAFGSYYALVIGNDDYRDMPDLESAINDADAVSHVLERRYGFQVTTLRDATRYEILSALNALTAKLTRQDNLLVYYAGHGELDRVNQVGHWLPVDAERENPANWLSTRSLTDMLNLMKARHVMVVADSCYSGALTRAAVTRLKAGELSDERLNWIKAQLDLRVRTALTSGGLKPVLDVGDGKHSLFARSFIDVLEANDGLLDGLSLYQAISARVVQAARELDFDQMPEYAPIRHGHHENGHFIFVPRA